MIRRRLITLILILIVIASLILFIRSAWVINHSVDGIKGTTNHMNDKKHIILISPEKNTPYWILLEQGAREQANELGYLLQYIGPERQNTNEVKTLLQKALIAKPDAIITQGLSQYDEWIADAAEANIPLITVDTDSATSNRLAYVGTDNIRAGKQLAALMTEYIEAPAKVGVIIGDEQSNNQIIRLESLTTELEAKNLEIVDIKASNISRLQAANATLDMIEQYPELNVIVGLSGLDGLGISDALSTLKLEHIAVFGFDNLLNTEQLIMEQKMIGTVVQQPYEIGKHAINVLHQYFIGEDYPNNTYIPTTTLTKELLEGTNEN